jgi:hypothetical protein
MRRHAPTLALSALILALLTWYFWPTPTPATASVPSALPAPALAPQSKIENPNSKISASPSERSPLADTLNAPASTLRADLSVVHEVITAFRTNYPRDGNPVGTNAEITAVLTGQNKLRLALIPPDHPAINRTTGELLDRWGTPFFFHAESGTRMSITSAGPDKKLHTPDDETFTP